MRRDITRLWREIFNDGEEYIELVMRSGFLPDCSPMIRQDGRTIAMAVGLRYDFKDKEVKAWKDWMYAESPLFHSIGDWERPGKYCDI